ncbi:MAG TPA: sigma-54 dependent transcriptional regulator [Thermoanaerobaculia bacterium]|nr:sigma-54 dependent transcriptional regulator [Thermoanaerobaculia bacterium]
MKGTVLIVDDEPYVRDSLAAVLKRRDFRVRTASGSREVLEAGMLSGVDVVLSDLRLVGEDGHDLLRQVAAREPNLPVVVLTGHGTVTSAVECMKAGAWDYLLKPADPEELVLVLTRALEGSSAQRELAYLRKAAGTPDDSERPLGVSAAWRQVLELAEIAAPVDTPVLILGESGTGKEVVARYLHSRSARSRGAFVSVNCGAIPAELFESEFFGHRRGAFTGAIEDRDGRFRIAHRGTLFLDEINSLPAVAQAKVLRVLQDGTFERVGDSHPTTVDVRLICASNADLEHEVESGRFRRDLFYRVNVLTITIPPLRERPEDVPVLAAAFLEELSRKLRKPVTGIAPATVEWLIAYAWPGNVRELKNVVERGILLERSEVLTPESLPLALRRPLSERVIAAAPLPEDLTLRANLSLVEQRLLQEALNRSGGVKREAARLLGIDERNLAYFLKKHGLMKARGENRA